MTHNILDLRLDNLGQTGDIYSFRLERDQNQKHSFLLRSAIFQPSVRWLWLLAMGSRNHQAVVAWW